MNTPTALTTTTLLQKGIAAARAGRSNEARQLLQRVVTTDPNSEMAWLWLSGLMTTNEQKRNCLERVLTANPNNVYAQAGLERLQGTALQQTNILEARLAAVTNGQPDSNLTSKPDLFETICPSCDEPVSVEASRCPHCFILFHAVDELPDSVQTPPPARTQTRKPQRKNVLRFLGAILSS